MRRADSENAVSQPWEPLIGSPFFVSCRYRRISVKGFSVADSPNNRDWESKSLFVGGLPTPKTQAPLIEQIARNTAPPHESEEAALHVAWKRPCRKSFAFWSSYSAPSEASLSYAIRSEGWQSKSAQSFARLSIEM